ncbi:MAG TPA: hypothetical protein VD926_05960 [Acidimicrobiales bacterium]|nr:hypothetical protein [Acidimicrobiales bacterium]
MAGEPLQALRERVRPVTLTGDQRLPALPALADVLPGGGVRRGSVVGLEGPGSTSLLWALLAPATEAGSWGVLVGLPSAGLLAAAGAGVALERLAVVAPPGRSAWPTVLGSLLDGFDVVVAAPHKVRPADARRLTARARERGTVVVLAGDGSVSAWPEGVDLRLALTTPEWRGLGNGHGHLQRRRVHLEVSGRREAARPRSADLWLPAAVDPVAPVAPDPLVLAPDSAALATGSGARTHSGGSTGPTIGELVRAAS